jgi:uncharacterized protein YciI
MFIILLTFTEPGRVAELKDPHLEWLRRGFDDGVFVLAGGVHGEPGGGTIIASGIAAEEVRQRVDADPFVAEGIATATILEISPSRVDERLAFLAPALGGAPGSA